MTYQVTQHHIERIVYSDGHCFPLLFLPELKPGLKLGDVKIPIAAILAVHKDATLFSPDCAKHVENFFHEFLADMRAIQRGIKEVYLFEEDPNKAEDLVKVSIVASPKTHVLNVWKNTPLRFDGRNAYALSLREPRP